MRTRTTVEDPRRDWTVGCLRSRAFDGVFLFGCAALSLASGFGAWYRPEWLIPILAFDILVLSSQHVIATYSRLYFDRLSFRRHRFLTLIAPWIALLWVVGLFMLGGTTLVTTLYLYVQWFHYVGQGYSVERQYAFRVPGVRPQFDLLSAAAVTAIPLFGILHRSLQKRLNPDEVYLTFNFTPLPVTHAVVSASGVLAIVICGAWLFRQIERYTEGKATVPQTLYMIIHWGIFLCGYYLIDDITCVFTPL